MILGGTPFGNDLGTGRARSLSPAKVRAIASLLSGLTSADLRRRYAPQAKDAADIYPGGLVEWERAGDEPLQMLLQSFNDLRDFYRRAADAGQAVVFAWG